jgi:hypothetical protein
VLGPSLSLRLPALGAWLSSACADGRRGQGEAQEGFAQLEVAVPSSPFDQICRGQEEADEQAIMVTWYDEADWRS